MFSCNEIFYFSVDLTGFHLYQVFCDHAHIGIIKLVLFDIELYRLHKNVQIETVEQKMLNSWRPKVWRFQCYIFLFKCIFGVVSYLPLFKDFCKITLSLPNC